MALRDLASGRRWSFAELSAEIEARPKASGPICHPGGHSADFVLGVLRAWRDGLVVCPLEAGQPAPTVPPPPETVVHLKTTSATTGDPRLVTFTGAQLAADADQIVATMGLRPEWPNLAVISMAHSYGFSNLVLPLLLHGIPLVVAASPLPESVRRAAAEFSDLTLPGVPALWRAWHEAGTVPPNVRLAISAGAPLPLALEQAVFQSAGLKIHNFYGSTECGGIAYDSSPSPRTDEACTGGPMHKVTLAVNEEGCLVVSGDNVGLTYWPEADPALADGYFRTSDLAEIKDGQVFLRGRLGDRINVAGRKIAPEPIERALLTHPAIEECVVFGVPSQDPDRSEIVVAGVKARGEVDPTEFKHFLLERLPAWQVPREWWFVEDISANHRGKISRIEWRNRYLARSAD